MEIKIQLLTPTAKIPTRTYSTDTGYDIYADSVEYISSPPQIKVYTGIAVQPEPGYYVEIYPRSSLAKKFVQLANSVGIIDETYTGQIIIVFNKIPSSVNRLDMNLGNRGLNYPAVASVEVGEKIAQMVVRKRIDAEFTKVDALDKTLRGAGGFGSTGK